MGPTSQQRDRTVIVGLDFLRFAAAALVVGFHLCSATWIDSSAYSKILDHRASYPELVPFTWFGWLGVELFFVISGVVISYSAEGASPRDFAWKRFLRLYPAAWICATITAITVLSLGLTSRGALARQWLGSVLLSPLPPWVDGAYWTLGVEMAFYAVIFWLLAAARFRYLEPVMLTIGCISSSYWIVGSLLAPDWLLEHLWDRILELTLISYGCYFALGTLVYLVHRNGVTLARTVAILLFLVAALVEISYKAQHIKNVWKISAPATIPQTLFVAFFALIVCSMLLAGRGSRTTQWIARTAGLATYPLYLLHDIFGAAIMRWTVHLGKYTAILSAAVVCVALSVIISSYGEPAVRRLFGRRRATAPRLDPNRIRNSATTDHPLENRSA